MNSSSLILRLLGLTILLTVIFMLSRFERQADGQAAQLDLNIWQDVGEATLPRQGGQRDIRPQQYRLVAVDLPRLDQILQQSRQSSTRQAHQRRLPLPLPDGTISLFIIEEAPVMTAPLQAKYPHIRTYRGRSLLDPTATVRLDRTPTGFHALILSSRGTVYIDPYRRGDVTHYLSYYRRDFQQSLPTRWSDRVLTAGAPPAPRQATLSFGDTLRTYRLAVATTGEYTAYHQQGEAGIERALAAVVTTINRVTAIFERELAVRFELVATNDALIYTDSDDDPYTHDSSSLLIFQNQVNLDTVIGADNYDIGHIFDTGSGGLASLSSVCTNRKAQGVTGQPTPIGDPFDVDYVAHEIGHQFGANHTYNTFGAANCTTRNSPTAYEPGSGSTIMAYAGTCLDEDNPTINQDLQPHSDAYFHGISLQEMVAFINGTGSSCARQTPQENQPPTVEAGPSWDVPVGTSFRLTGTAADSDGDTLTYAWEQFDLGNAWTDPTTLPNTDTGENPIFRSYLPSERSYRDLPAWDNPLAQIGESLPLTDRALTFRLTVRDQRGGLAFDSSTVNVTTAAGPFVITNLAAGTVWSPGETQSIEWDVAGTDGSPFDCRTVDITLQSDPHLATRKVDILAEQTPNDGQATVTLPDAVTLPAYLRIDCAEQIFYAQETVNICTPLLIDNVVGEFTRWQVSNGVGETSWQGRDDGGHTGDYYWFIPDTETLADAYLISQAIDVPQERLLLRFWHRYQLEADDAGQFYHGGVVEINVNSTGWRDVGATNFVKNGYNATISQQFDSLLAGRAAFSDNSSVFVESILDVSAFVTAGDRVRLRFRKVSDSAAQPNLFKQGWSLDDLLICADAPSVTVSNPTVTPLLTPTPSISPTPPIQPTPTPDGLVTRPLLVTQALTLTPTNGLTLTWGSGSFAEMVTLTYQPRSPESLDLPAGWQFLGFAYLLTATNEVGQVLTQTERPYTVTVSLTESIDGARVYQHEGDSTGLAWQQVAGSRLLTETGQLEANPLRLGLNAVLRPPKLPVYLPIVRR